MLEYSAQLFFGLLKYPFLFCRQIFSGAVNIEIEHGHGGAEWIGLAPEAIICRTFKRLCDLAGIRKREHSLFKVKRVAFFCNPAGPVFILHLKYFFLNERATLTSNTSTGTSTSGPMTVANACWELMPNIATATAIASSKSLLAAVNETAVVWA